MKYLGLRLDRRLSFEDHFREVKSDQAALALARLLPNLGGPGGKARRLYAGVVASIALYSAPVWAGEAAKNRRIQSALHNAQRRIAGRIIKAYKTVSHAVATTLAGTPPLLLLVESYAETYATVARIKARRGYNAITPDLVAQIKDRNRRDMMLKWEQWISSSGRGGSSVVRAILPRLGEWTSARTGLSCRATQILTGHGCFGRFLRRIGRETTEKC
ncbi:PREDICTED: uncharacterized protein LOC108761264 [Trachymyrmex cornetzi]|uniref:uncharacterized protein LOC108761264 n=1 Tax=Trachymyrmex cornetzi TaxID=471704 RepID=UPI00084F5B03|nr:PREDICTED: uncharacterized protein LOC108761264 [Trachymyrmex cornetzi]